MHMVVRSRHTTVSECNKTTGYGEAGLLKPTKTKSFARHGVIMQQIPYQGGQWLCSIGCRYDFTHNVIVVVGCAISYMNFCGHCFIQPHTEQAVSSVIWCHLVVFAALHNDSCVSVKLAVNSQQRQLQQCVTHYGTCRFRHYYCTASIVFIVLGIRSAFLCSVMKLLQSLFFYTEFKISSVALVLRLAGLLSHLFAITIIPVTVVILLHQHQPV